MKMIVFIFAFLLALLCFGAFAQTPLERYNEADNSINGGDGYKTSTNETATLAWGESYIMASYISAYHGSGDTYYLDKLVDHADHVLANRDDSRGVVDYRGVSGAAWRNLHYQPEQQPYCYVVHSGMISYPLASFVKIVRETPALWTQITYGGVTYLEKADTYSMAVYETLAFHEDQWVDDGDAGYYIFRPDATFLPYEGSDLPLNQGNALGRTIVTMAQAEDDADLYMRAERMARWLEDQLDLSLLYDAYRWNYWGGHYSAPGEDISHAAINADFALLCAEVEVVFDEVDAWRFARTFSKRIYFSSEKRYDHVGGSGSYNSPGYTEQTGRWLRASPFDPTVSCAIRNQFDAMSTDTGSGSVVLGFGNVARYDLPDITQWYFTVGDWEDEGDYRVPLSEEAGIYFVPSKTSDSKIALKYEADSLVTVRQLNDIGDIITARFGATDSEPRTLYFAYHSDVRESSLGYGALFRLKNVNKVYEGEAIPDPPSITSVPDELAYGGVPYAYQVRANGTMPIHYTATIEGESANISLLTGLMEHTFSASGEYELVVSVRNTAGQDDQNTVVTVLEPENDDDDTGTDDDDSSQDDDGATDDDDESGDEDDGGSSGCCG